jgi:hypothetical protein
MPDNQIQERIQSLHPTYGMYVVGSMPTVIAQTFAETYKFNSSQAMALENGIQLLLLFFIDEPGLSDFLTSECNLKADEAQSLTTGIVLALPQDIRNMYKITSAEVFTNDLSKEILEAEAVLNTIPKPLPRPEEKVFTTTQSAILAEAKVAPAAVPLPPPSSSTPRWDTEK